MRRGMRLRRRAEVRRAWVVLSVSLAGLMSAQAEDVAGPFAGDVAVKNGCVSFYVAAMSAPG